MRPDIGAMIASDVPGTWTGLLGGMPLRQDALQDQPRRCGSRCATAASVRERPVQIMIEPIFERSAVIRLRQASGVHPAF